MVVDRRGWEERWLGHIETTSAVLYSLLAADTFGPDWSKQNSDKLEILCKNFVLPRFAVRSIDPHTDVNLNIRLVSPGIGSTRFIINLS